ncbi:MAG: GTP-binding protein, partial [Comamonadaceae bacterium]
MKEYKILFSGTAGAGKTTAISAISETQVVSTDVANTDAALKKATTTVGLDYGSITLDSGDRVRLFGTP